MWLVSDSDWQRWIYDSSCERTTNLCINYTQAETSSALSSSLHFQFRCSDLYADDLSLGLLCLIFYIGQLRGDCVTRDLDVVFTRSLVTTIVGIWINDGHGQFHKGEPADFRSSGLDLRTGLLFGPIKLRSRRGHCSYAQIFMPAGNAHSAVAFCSAKFGYSPAF